MPAKRINEHQAVKKKIVKCKMVNDTTGVLQNKKLNLHRALDICPLYYFIAKYTAGLFSGRWFNDF